MGDVAKKILEAKFFLEKMDNVCNRFDVPDFHYYTSAFLSSARSALQYLFKRLDGNDNKSWYDQQVQQSKIIKFLKEERNSNIHHKPVSPKKIIHVTVMDSIGVGDCFYIEQRDATGKVVEQDFTGIKPGIRRSSTSESPQVVEKYYFKGWSGSEDVCELSRAYNS